MKTKKEIIKEIKKRIKEYEKLYKNNKDYEIDDYTGYCEVIILVEWKDLPAKIARMEGIVKGLEYVDGKEFYW